MSAHSSPEKTPSLSDASLLSAEVCTQDDLSLNFAPRAPFNLWKKLSSCEEFVGAKRSKHTIVAWNDRIYVFGGDDGRRMLNDFLVSHIRDSSWARVVYTGTPPAPRYHHSAVVFNDSMFVFGGYTGDIYSNSNLRNKNDLFEYKFTTSQWIDWSDRISGDLPPARSAHGAVIYGNYLWIYAGYDGHTRLNDMWRIDLTSSSPSWEKMGQAGDSPPTCCNFPVAVIGDDMYVFSGQSGAKITNNMYKFNFLDRVWLRIRTEHLLRGTSSPPQRRYGHTMVPFRRSLYVYGGSADGIMDNDVHCFDIDTHTWSIMTPAEGGDVPCRRVFHSAAVWNNGMYVFGGTVEDFNRSGDLFRFSLSTFPKCTLIEDFSRLLRQEQFYDIKVELGECVVKAHSAILAARSPFLRQKILSAHQQAPSKPLCTEPNFIPSKPLTVELPEVSGEAFKLAVYSLYTDRIHPDLETSQGVSSTQMLLMVDVYKVALLLETELLVQLSMQYIKASINEQNVLLVLKNATELHLTSLKDYCLQFIVREPNYRAVIMSSTFESLDKSLMVQIIRQQQSRSRPTSPDPPLVSTPPSLKQDLQNLLISENGQAFTDVLLRVGDETVPSHKAVLVARCSYFEALFRSFSPQNHSVEITFGKTVPSLQSFMSLLKYVYYGEVDMPPEDSLIVFSAPNFFGFANSQLHSHCRSCLERKVCKENVMAILEVSDAIEVHVMKRHCLEMIADNFSDIVHDPYFRGLSRELLLDILDILASKL